MQRHILIAGPESTGTRAAAALLEAQCPAWRRYRNTDHRTARDPFWAHTNTASYTLAHTQWLQLITRDILISRRSFPHDRAWPDLAKLATFHDRLGYSTTLLITTRDITATIKSQLAAHHSTTEQEAGQKIAHAANLLSNNLFDKYLLSLETAVVYGWPYLVGILQV